MKDPIAELETVAKACAKCQISAQIRRNEDGFFMIDFADGKEGFFSGVRQAVVFIKDNYCDK